MSTRASCNFLYRHIRPFRVDYAIIPIITIAKVFSEKNWLNAIPITSCMLCSKIAKRIPVSTFMELPISGRIVSKYIERCIIRIALNILAIDQQAASLFLCCELTCRIISKQWPACVTGYVTGSPLTSSQKVFRTIFCSGFSGCFFINILDGVDTQYSVFDDMPQEGRQPCSRRSEAASIQASAFLPPICGP